MRECRDFLLDSDSEKLLKQSYVEFLSYSMYYGNSAWKSET